MTTDPKATPTPQAQAGDAMARGLLNAYLRSDAESFTVTREFLQAFQAPARDAGAVAWRYELVGKSGEIANSAVSTHRYNLADGISPFGRAGIDYHEEGTVTERPLIYAYTHPAAASDDARRLLRECRDYVHNAAVDEAEMNAHRRTQKHGDRDLLARIDAALSSPDGRGEGSA